MTHYLVSFPAAAMQLSAPELEAAGVAARATVEAARDAGVLRFTGGIVQDTGPVLVAADGTVREGTHPQTAGLDGGFCVLELPSRAEAERWAARLAEACRCDQELRAFGEGSMNADG